MSPTSQSPWLSRFAALTALATLGLIALGGLVTSHGAGMAVPDWPTTYGYNMFLFPVSQWVGGIFYEHTHRLWASGVGLLTVILAVALQLRARDRSLVRLGWAAVVLVVFQGILGGLRVSLMKDQIGVFHAGLAQAFLVLVTWIAVAASPAWCRWRETAPVLPGGLSRLLAGLTAAIFVQLLVGATMRHQHAGLAIPDFPLAYGSVWPPTDDAFLARINALRTDTRDFHPITAFQIHAHMVHRLLALGIVLGVVVAARQTWRRVGFRSLPGRLMIAWVAALGVQGILGAVTVWSNKAADVATAHVVVGAICLGLGSLATASSLAARVQAAGRDASPAAQLNRRGTSATLPPGEAALLGSKG